MPTGSHPFSQEADECREKALSAIPGPGISLHLHDKTFEKGGTTDRPRIKALTRNRTGMINAGNPSAVRSYEKYKAAMPPFTALTDTGLNNLAEYLKA